jgi:hypothetical protein
MTPYPTLVRIATPEDFDELSLFVPQVLGENSILPVSSTKIEAQIERCVNRVDGAIAGIIDGEDGIDAGIGLAFCESDLSDIPYVRAVWCGLHPNARRRRPASEADPRGHYGNMLIEFTKWCHESLEQIAGHPILYQLDILTIKALAAKVRLYQRGLTQIGASFGLGANGEFFTQDEAELADGYVPPTGLELRRRANIIRSRYVFRKKRREAEVAA